MGPTHALREKARRITRPMLLAVVVASSGCGSPDDRPAEATYPSRPITFITHSSPGGGGDVFLRELTKHLEGLVPVPMVVENRSGGGSAAAVSHVATSRPDGYLLYGATPTTLATPIITRTRHSFLDLEPIANVFFDPLVPYVRSDSPWETLPELIEAARARPGEIRWGVAAPGAVEHMIAFDVQKVAGIQVQPVTFEGGGDLAVAVLGGHVDVGVGEFGELTSLIGSGRIRALASFTAERLAGTDLPTAQELGLDVVKEKFRGLLGPRGIPPEVIHYWEGIVQRVLQDEGYRERYQAIHLVPAYMGHEEFGRYLGQSDGSLRSYMRELGILQ